MSANHHEHRANAMTDAGAARIGKEFSMRRTGLRLLALAAVLALPLAAAPGRAQEATPAAEPGGLPPGVAIVPVTELGDLELPAEPSALAVYRLLMEPGAAIPTHPHPGLEFAVVESGSFSFLTVEGPAVQLVRGGAEAAEATPEAAGPGAELTAVAGDVAVFPAGNRSDTRAGDEGVTILIFEIVTP